jgi:hypothetical protein
MDKHEYYMRIHGNIIYQYSGERVGDNRCKDGILEIYSQNCASRDRDTGAAISKMSNLALPLAQNHSSGGHP